MSVKDMLTFVLVRCRLKLEVKFQSSVLDSYYPDFNIQPTSQGDAVIRKLLFFVPDVVFINGDKAYMVHPTASESASYSYGLDHTIMEGRYRKGSWEPNHVQVVGSNLTS